MTAFRELDPWASRKHFCKHCKEEVIGQKNLARVYHKLEGDAIMETYLVHAACVPAFLGTGMSYEKGSGQVACTHCGKGISGEAVIGYKYEDDYVEDIRICHKECVKSFKLQVAGKVHKCPKCNGDGHKVVNTLNIYQTSNRMEVVLSTDVYRYPEKYREGKLEKVRDITEPCQLCDGDGFLEKSPVPVITDWKKAT